MALTLPPLAWLERLNNRIDTRWTRPLLGMGAYDAYFEGDHRLAFATAKYREAFGNLFASPVDNWMPLVIDSRVERLEVQGFRFGEEADHDDDAWGLWQASGMDAQSDMVHEESVKLGEAYWLIEPPAPGSDDPPRITAEHPSQTIVACDPGDPNARLAALKKWLDDDGYLYATLYLPDAIYKYRSREKPKDGYRVEWVPRRNDEGGSNPLGEVPVIPVRNRPRMSGPGRSDLQGLLTLQDALNKLLSDMLIGSEYQAFPQRVVMGVQVPRDPTTGQPIRAAEMQASQSRLWTFESPDAKVSEFNAADLDNYVKSREHIVKHITAQSRTPPHYIAGQIVNVSSDALKAAETGLVAVVRRKFRPFGEAHEDAMRLAFKAVGDEGRANETRAETIWKDPESRSFAELIDGLVKLATIGVPQEVLWERAGFSPTEIGRMRGMAQADQILTALTQPAPPAQSGFSGANGNGANGAAPLNGGAGVAGAA
jgi:hypothetical protein